MAKILIVGNKGMVGSSIERALKNNSENQIITVSRSELDLRNQSAVNEFIKQKKPDQIYIAAAKVGGIYANSKFPADFIYDNLMIETNLINGAFNNKVRKVLFLGSSCIYPKFCKQPITEETLLTGSLEQSNEAYAIAKIAGIKLCESYNIQYASEYGIDYRSVMPTNLYGEGDNYHPMHSHVIPSLIRKFHEGKINKTESVVVWGSGSPKREFLYVDDMAEACIHVMNCKRDVFESVISTNCSHINVGYGEDITIHELSMLIKEIIGYEGNIIFDTSMPDGTPRKLLDSTKIKSLGWRPKTTLENGIKKTYDYFINS